MGGRQHIGWANGNGRAFTVQPSYEVAQVSEFLALDKALILHPEIVVQFGQVLIARIGSKSNDRLGFGLLATILQCRRQHRARRRSGKDSLLS